MMDTMTHLKAQLNRLETRLQALIEGSAARLVPLRGEADELPHQLVAAMQAGIQRDDQGVLLAPNLFTLIVHPSQVQALYENQALLDELAESLRQSAVEAGLRYYVPPVIKIAADPGIPPQQLRIQARFSPPDLGHTSTLAVDIGAEASDIPPNAFLIVQGRGAFPLTQPVLNLGRRVDNHLVLTDPRVSRVHAQLRAIKGRYVIFDLDSTGGTFVNGFPIRQCTLVPGDVISLAGVQLVFGQDNSGLTDETQKSRPIPSPLA
jgi:hypothetical protein